MIGAPGCDLWQVGHDEHLAVRGEGRQLLSHGQSGAAADSRVDLVEDQRANGRQRIDDRAKTHHVEEAEVERAFEAAAARGDDHAVAVGARARRRQSRKMPQLASLLQLKFKKPIQHAIGLI